MRPDGVEAKFFPLGEKAATPLAAQAAKARIAVQNFIVSL